jgi:hypothetical protein
MHRNAVSGQVLFDIRDCASAKMKDAGRQHGIRRALSQHLDHVIQAARAAAGHHQHVHTLTDTA